MVSFVAGLEGVMLMAVDLCTLGMADMKTSVRTAGRQRL